MFCRPESSALLRWRARYRGMRRACPRRGVVWSMPSSSGLTIAESVCLDSRASLGSSALGLLRAVRSLAPQGLLKDTGGAALGRCRLIVQPGVRPPMPTNPQCMVRHPHMLLARAGESGQRSITEVGTRRRPVALAGHALMTCQRGGTDM